MERVADKKLPTGKLIGESWELYDFPPGAVGPDARLPCDSPDRWTSSVISDGPLAGENLHSVMLLQSEALLGGTSPVETEHGPQFPLLIKFLDARQDLSVQVHPPARYVKDHPEARLKNECWFVLDHLPGARNLIGAKPGTTREQFEQSLGDGSCEKLLNAIDVKTGDTFYLPSGTVHALGAGIVVAEVQTPSDTTYRVYDFDRIDPATGRKRTLHIQQSLDCIDFENDWRESYIEPGDDDRAITQTAQFTMFRRSAKAGARPEPGRKQLRAIIVLEGHLQIGSQPVSASVGETVLIPASIDGSIKVESDSRWLEVQLPE